MKAEEEEEEEEAEAEVKFVASCDRSIAFAPASHAKFSWAARVRFSHQV